MPICTHISFDAPLSSPSPIPRVIPIGIIIPIIYNIFFRYSLSIRFSIQYYDYYYELKAMIERCRMTVRHLDVKHVRTQPIASALAQFNFAAKLSSTIRKMIIIIFTFSFAHFDQFKMSIIDCLWLFTAFRPLSLFPRRSLPPPRIRGFRRLLSQIRGRNYRSAALERRERQSTSTAGECNNEKKKMKKKSISNACTSTAITAKQTAGAERERGREEKKKEMCVYNSDLLMLC